MLKPNPRRVWSAFCIIEPQITLATLIVVLTAVSHGLLVIDAGKLHFYGIKCTFKMRHNGPHYNLLHPLMIALYPPWCYCITQPWSAECQVPGPGATQLTSAHGESHITTEDVPPVSARARPVNCRPYSGQLTSVRSLISFLTKYFRFS